MAVDPNEIEDTRSTTYITTLPSLQHLVDGLRLPHQGWRLARVHDPQHVKGEMYRVVVDWEWFPSPNTLE